MKLTLIRGFFFFIKSCWSLLEPDITFKDLIPLLALIPKTELCDFGFGACKWTT